jgi:hypothetical protein
MVQLCGHSHVKVHVELVMMGTMKGLADAPPEIMFIRGVSTSKKPRLSKKCLTYVTILDLVSEREREREGDSNSVWYVYVYWFIYV